MNKGITKVKISMPLIDYTGLQRIDNYYNDIAKDYTKAFLKEKEQVIVQRIIMNLQQENQSLKKQLEEINYTCVPNSDIKNVIDKYKNQQKEFIKYMNKTIEELECDDVDDEELKSYLIQRISTFKEILVKYKEMIGDK